MAEMTPEKLREVIKGHTATDWYGELANLRIAALAAADAWEAEVATLRIKMHTAEAKAATAAILLGMATKRLEAAFDVIARYQDFVAALAAKETP